MPAQIWRFDARLNYNQSDAGYIEGAASRGIVLLLFRADARGTWRQCVLLSRQLCAGSSLSISRRSTVQAAQIELRGHCVEVKIDCTYCVPD